MVEKEETVCRVSGRSGGGSSSQRTSGFGPSKDSIREAPSPKCSRGAALTGEHRADRARIRR